MNAESVRDQAERYLAWEARAGLPRVVAWRTWCASKSFGPVDVAAIAAEVTHLRVRAAAGSVLDLFFCPAAPSLMAATS